jgi:MoaA/NifB/PqqE/SkfB family radical SAM enzyme|tara:strand:- start:5743 stop:6792 length:1050 start_codon:yes stop_codon:yes gene_type:complete
MYDYKDIRQVHLEPTQKCQARCPMCDRNENGGKDNKYLTNADLSLADMKEMMPEAFVHQLENLYFCGNHGDPMMAPETLEIAQWLKEVNPKIRLAMNTNGGARTPTWWSQLAQTIDHVTFSVDGLDDTNHLYRQGVSWDKVEENMAAFCDAGGIAKWEFLVFKHNEHQIDEAELWSKTLGVKTFSVKKSGRYISAATLTKKDSHQSKDRHDENTQLLEPPSMARFQNKAGKEFDKVSSKFGSMDNYLDVADIDPKCIKKKEIYISAEGFVFPCCWTAGQMYKWWQKPGEAQIWEHIDKFDINAINTPIETIVDTFFNSIEKAWEVGPNRLKVCALKCNKAFDPFAAQWQ